MRIPLTLLGALLAGGAAAAPAIEQILPPAGLYRLDSASTSSIPAPAPANRVDTRVDGANGDIVRRERVAGADSGEQVFEGKGPVTHCIRPRRIADALYSSAVALASCPDQSSEVGADGVVVHTANCPAAVVTLTIRRIDKVTWEYDTVSATRAGDPAADLAWMRPVLEREAAEGKTPQARARAAQQLLDLPRLQRELAEKQVAVNVQYAKALREAKTPDAAAAVRATMAQSGKAVATQARQRVRWTRIGNSCAVGAGG
ncbi:hypothetical protein LXA47_07110 [Massilia sp. P8910]|uniref:hypothetical protein n=1 Tax=Massilia antarctica TaxID=2765360 RepID=UPI0006BB7D08|nr:MULTISPECIES: hypothetical protein [Massilia]MCE3603377.1 hypothetical protein [Massilia antarctica]MCY0912985.1 hypothetical protein [Massilia sp. H27-R4]CUI07565.1 hypothetical protein BN2497_9907 [Janthinobacterium sp. CG23_2]CUU31351.1 hypothetical protein BN3177_9907 [Janthinobacterium sp. CG23_2]